MLSVATAVGVVWLAALVIFMVLVDAPDDTLSLSGVPQGVSARRIERRPVFVTRDGDEVRVFLPDARHLPEDTLWWCPNEHLFVDAEHGSLFARDGLKVAGPARGGLNQYPVEVAGQRLKVDTRRIIEGNQTPRGHIPGLANVDYTEPWNSGSGTFCDGALSPIAGQMQGADEPR